MHACTPDIEKAGEEGPELKDRLGYVMRPCLDPLPRKEKEKENEMRAKMMKPLETMSKLLNGTLFKWLNGGISLNSSAISLLSACCVVC